MDRKDITHSAFSGAFGQDLRLDVKSSGSAPESDLERTTPTAADVREHAQLEPSPDTQIVRRDAVWLAVAPILVGISELSGSAIQGIDDAAIQLRIELSGLIEAGLRALPVDQQAHFLNEAFEAMGGQDAGYEHIHAFMYAALCVAFDRPPAFSAALRVVVAGLGGRWIPAHSLLHVVEALTGLAGSINAPYVTELMSELAGHVGGPAMSGSTIDTLLQMIYGPLSRAVMTPDGASAAAGVDIEGIVTVLVAALGGPTMSAARRDSFLQALFEPMPMLTEEVVARRMDAAQFFLTNLRRPTVMHRKADAKKTVYRFDAQVIGHHLAATADFLLHLPPDYGRLGMSTKRSPAQILQRFGEWPVPFVTETTHSKHYFGARHDDRSRQLLVDRLIQQATSPSGVSAVNKVLISRDTPTLDKAQHGLGMESIAKLIRDASGPVRTQMLKRVLNELAIAAPDMTGIRLREVYAKLWAGLGNDFDKTEYAREPMYRHLAILATTLSPSQAMSAMLGVAQHHAHRAVPVEPSGSAEQLPITSFVDFVKPNPGFLTGMVRHGAGEAAPFQLGAMVHAIVYEEAVFAANSGMFDALLQDLAGLRASLSPRQFIAMTTCFLTGLGANEMDEAQLDEWRIRVDAALLGGEGAIETKAGPAPDHAVETAWRLAKNPLSILIEPGFDRVDAMGLLELVYMEPTQFRELHVEQDSVDAITQLKAPAGVPQDDFMKIHRELAWRTMQIGGRMPIRVEAWALIHDCLLDRLQNAVEMDGSARAAESKDSKGVKAAQHDTPSAIAVAAELMLFYEQLEAAFDVDALFDQIGGEPMAPEDMNASPRTAQWPAVIDLIYSLKEEIRARIDGGNPALWGSLQRRLARTEFALLKALQQLDAWRVANPPAPPHVQELVDALNVAAQLDDDFDWG
ncbi:MAG TPA: hypothetical protein VLJ86_02610 [Ramlibacter sp.]|nr:hypothetical protein [Ramlibacter sp.]